MDLDGKEAKPATHGKYQHQLSQGRIKEKEGAGSRVLLISPSRR
jgi:hypothetical protein